MSLERFRTPFVHVTLLVRALLASSERQGRRGKRLSLRRDQRPDRLGLSDLLGDFSEQTGARFG